MTQQIESFVARDGSGQPHTIQVVRVFRVVRGPGDPPPGSRPLCTLQTTDGERVSRVQRGVYRLFPSGRILRSVEPEAF